ncbi:hypothetical protein [Nostoc sp.]|uniref:hypothetical protein n=1 Tax=Nostoc sp. TaxID=1180 RepID=UPI002FF619B5
MISYSIELATSSQLTVNLINLEIQTEQAQGLLRFYYQKAKAQGILVEFSYSCSQQC